MPNSARVNLKGDEKRKYKRLKTKLPVKFTISRIQGDLLPGIEWQSGFTSNVSKGGLCLEVFGIKESTITYLSRQDIYFEMKIQLPENSSEIKAVGELCWYQFNDTATPSKFLVGLQWRSIKKENLKIILSKAQKNKLFIYLAIFFGSLLIITLILNFYYL